MKEFYLEVAISNSKVLCIGPITHAEAHMCADENHFCDGYGHYLFVANAGDAKSDIQVLAKLASEDSAEMLSNIFKYRHLLST